MERRRFVERAAEETGLTADLLKRDMGKLLLAVEQAQAELSQPQASDRARRHADAGGTRGGVDVVARAEPDRPVARGVPPGGHHRRGNQHARCLSGGRVAQAGTAAGHHHPERERRRAKPRSMDAVLSFFPEEERVKYSRHDRPEPLLSGRDEPETQNPRGGRGGRGGESQLRVEAVAERRRVDHCQHRQRPGRPARW